MTIIAARKCVRHAQREAIARCPGCGEHFCRECVVEHDGLLLCASCLAARVAAAKGGKRTDWGRVREIVVTAACFVLLWVVFYGLGRFLEAIPATLHEGTVWKAPENL